MNSFSHFCSPQLQSKWSALAAEQPLARMCLLLKPKPSDVVCDVGTGMGSAALAIAPSTERVVTFDLEDQSRHLQGKGASNIEFQRADLSKGLLPCGDAAFDIVICRAALHHLEDKQQFFREAFRVLRPEGRLYLMDPVMSPRLRLVWSVISRIAERDYRAYVTEDELFKALADARLCVQYQGYFLFPRSLNQWIDEKINPKLAEGGDASSEFVAHVRHCIRNIVVDLFDDDLKSELHLQSETPEGWFAYNCMEILARKG